MEQTMQAQQQPHTVVARPACLPCLPACIVSHTASSTPGRPFAVVQCRAPSRPAWLVVNCLTAGHYEVPAEARRQPILRQQRRRWQQGGDDGEEPGREAGSAGAAAAARSRGRSPGGSAAAAAAAVEQQLEAGEEDGQEGEGSRFEGVLLTTPHYQYVSGQSPPEVDGREARVCVGGCRQRG